MSTLTQKLLDKSKLPLLLLGGFIVAYSLYFSWYTINRHNTLNSYAADLSLIDQPMWNTVRGPGGFMELTWGSRQQPRLAEHFEPILIPLALLFFVRDDVRILLIAQSIALALGALPVYWIARHQFTTALSPHHSSANPHAKHPRKATTQSVQSPREASNLHAKRPISNYPLTTWAALAFSVAYLLFPPLQAANIADFHADPFVVTPLLFAFWYASQKHWGWMWLWAIIAMASKETLPPLVTMLGLYLLFDHYRTRPKSPSLLSTDQLPISNYQSPITNQTLHPLLLILSSILWFGVATFLIVSPLAEQYFGTDGPIYLANRYQAGPTELFALLQDPTRWYYLIGLLTAVGFLPLLAPELLILGLPVLVANLLSNFPGQYSGEQHYSAPLVVAFIIAAIYGTRRLLNNISLREINGQPLRLSVLGGTALWLLTWSLSYHALHGWTPLSIRTETYVLSAAAARLPALIEQIPTEAIVSASAAIHPHLAHRRVVYLFPTVEEADYLLVDVTDIPGVHPNDAQAQLRAMLADSWQVLAADQGLLLAQKVASPTPLDLPPSFLDFARTTASPAQPSPLAFGEGELRLLGYEVQDDPDDGVIFRFYWQATHKLPPNLQLWPLIYDDSGQLLSDPNQVPMIAPLWYPPEQWQLGEAILTETLPQRLPDTFHLGIAAGPAGSLSDPSRLYPIRPLLEDESSLSVLIEPVSTSSSPQQPSQWVQLASFQRQGPFLQQLPPAPTFHPLTPLDVRLGDSLHLIGFWQATEPAQPGQTLPILLRWEAETTPPTDFTVFIHLLTPEGSMVSQSDAFPTWLISQPTSRWSPGQSVMDRHSLILPLDLPPGSYRLYLGLYDAQTLQRQPLATGEDTFLLGQVQVEK